MLVNKLVQECTGNIEETRLVQITSAKNENKHKCSSCMLCIVLFSILFTINVGMGSYFVYSHWYLKKRFYSCWQVNELINGKSQTNKDQKSNLLFLQRQDQSQKFRLKLGKNRQKKFTKGLIFTTLDT